MTPAGIRFDHVVVVVGSLAAATAEFRSAGFTVTPGGRHDAIPTENALVCFADGSYLELLAARDASLREELRGQSAGAGWERHLRGVSAVARRFLPILAGPDGVSDWALRADSLPRRAAGLRAAGLKAAGPVRMSRERTAVQGAPAERIEWELLLPESLLHPFWIADRTPRERRVPGDSAATTHENGARAIASVRVRAPSVATAALELGDALDLRPRVESRTTVLAGSDARIEVVEGEPSGACGVMLAGCAPLPETITTLGVRPAAA